MNNMKKQLLWSLAVVCSSSAGMAYDLQSEIDAAAARGGGEVVVQTGEREMRPFSLKSNVTLRLEEGAVLLASTNIADYASALGERYFIYAGDATNVAIVGKGAIDGRGAAFREKRGLKGESQPQALPVLMRFSRCRDVRLEGFEYRNGAAWGCHIRNCDGVVMRGVKCFNHVNNTNDGIDIESANVLIEDCDIDADDDAISIKTESDKSFAVTNVVIRNCRLASCCNAFKCGTGSYADVKDVLVENCVFTRAAANHRFSWWQTIPGVTNRICGISVIALEVVDGGRMDGVTVRNIKMDGYQTPVFVRHHRRHEPQPGKETYLRNVLIENLRGVADSRIASSITGISGLRPRGITLRNVSLVVPGGGTEEDAARPVPERETAYPESFMFGKQPLPACGFYVRHADDVAFENVEVRCANPDAREMFVFDDAGELGPAGIECVAHRGYWNKAIPENTVEAMKRAYDCGADWVETDFNLMPDGSMLCFHDPKTRDRVIKPPFHVPTLEEILAVVPKDRHVQCEIKKYGGEYAAKFDAAVKAAGLKPENIVVSGFSADNLKDFKRRAPHYRTMWLVGAGQLKDGGAASVGKIIEKAREIGAFAVCPGAVVASKAGWTRAESAKIRSAGFSFRLFGVNKPEMLSYAARVGAEAFTCNFYEDAFKWAAEKGVKLKPTKAGVRKNRK